MNNASPQILTSITWLKAVGFEHKSSAQSKELDMDCFEKPSKLTAQHIPHDVDDVSSNQVSKIRSLDELMASRYSCREFDPKRQVDTAILEKIIASGSLSPSACNKQPYFFFGVGFQGMGKLNALRPWYGASAMILGCRDDQEKGWVRPSDQEPFADFDLGLAMMPMALKAEELGLGSCFIASFSPKYMRKILGIDDRFEPHVALVLGYPLIGPCENHFKRKDSICAILD